MDEVAFPLDVVLGEPVFDPLVEPLELDGVPDVVPLDDLAPVSLAGVVADPVLPAALEAGVDCPGEVLVPLVPDVPAPAADDEPVLDEALDVLDPVPDEVEGLVLDVLDGRVLDGLEDPTPDEDDGLVLEELVLDGDDGLVFDVLEEPIPDEGDGLVVEDDGLVLDEVDGLVLDVLDDRALDGDVEDVLEDEPSPGADDDRVPVVDEEPAPDELTPVEPAPDEVEAVLGVVGYEAAAAEPLPRSSRDEV